MQANNFKARPVDPPGYYSGYKASPSGHDGHASPDVVRMSYEMAASDTRMPVRPVLGRNDGPGGMDVGSSCGRLEERLSG